MNSYDDRNVRKSNAPLWITVLITFLTLIIFLLVFLYKVTYPYVAMSRVEEHLEREYKSNFTFISQTKKT